VVEEWTLLFLALAAEYLPTRFVKDVASTIPE
jgi:hypothetical protein